MNIRYIDRSSGEEKEEVEKKALRLNQITEKVEKAEEFIAQGFSITSACKMVKLSKPDYYKFKRGEF